MADPAAFKLNRDFEARLGSQIRDAGGSATVKSPAQGADFTPENGSVNILFRGTAPAAADSAQFPLILRIYNNQAAAGRPVFTTGLKVDRRDSDPWTFSKTSKLSLKAGLYYFTIERTTEEDLIFVGKFTVGAQNSK